MHLNFTINSSFFDEINYFTRGDNNSDTYRGQTNREQIITSIAEQVYLAVHVVCLLK